MKHTIEKIFKLASDRIYHLHNEDDKGYYKGNKTYLDGIIDELEEVIPEIKKNNSVYLEDELGDVLWNYFCLIHSLKEDKLIDETRVFERCYKKFSERLANNPGKTQWSEVKKIQKVKLKKEHQKKYGN